MNSLTLALVYFGFGLFGAMIFGAIKKKSISFWLVTLSGVAVYLCKYLSNTTSLENVLDFIWGCSVMFLSGTVAMFLMQCYFRLKSNKSKQAVKRGSTTGRITKSMKRKMMGRAIIVLPIVLVVATGFVMINTSLATSSGSGMIDNSIATPSELKNKTMNILICGIDNDQNDDAHSQKMTDVIIVANIDLDAKKASLLQIPRDTYVAEKTTTGKINAIYNDQKDSNSGINALAGEINNMMQLPVDNYVTITMEGFRKAVDEIGGIEVNLEEQMVFNLRDPDEIIVNTIILPAGINVLDGVMADLFVRYRDYARADIDRLNMQRVFMAALMNKLVSLPATQLLGIVSAVYPYLSTDFSVAELAELALKAKGFSSDSITAIRIPGEPVSGVGSSKQSVFTIHKEELANILNEYMRPHSDDVSADKLTAIELQNTTGLLDNSDKPLSDYGAIT